MKSLPVPAGTAPKVTPARPDQALRHLAQRAVAAHAHHAARASGGVLGGQLRRVTLAARQHHLAVGAVPGHHLLHGRDAGGAEAVARDRVDDEHPSVGAFHADCSPFFAMPRRARSDDLVVAEVGDAVVGDGRAHRHRDALARIHVPVVLRFQGPGAVDAHGQQVELPLAQDPDEPALEVLHLAGGRAGALGKDADRQPFVRPAYRLAEGLGGIPQAAGLDRDVAHGAEEMAEHGDALQVSPAHEGHPRAARRRARARRTCSRGSQRRGSVARAIELFTAAHVQPPAHEPERQARPGGDAGAGDPPHAEQHADGAHAGADEREGKREQVGGNGGERRPQNVEDLGDRGGPGRAGGHGGYPSTPVSIRPATPVSAPPDTPVLTNATAGHHTPLHERDDRAARPPEGTGPGLLGGTRRGRAGIRHEAVEGGGAPSRHAAAVGHRLARVAGRRGRSRHARDRRGDRGQARPARRRGEGVHPRVRGPRAHRHELALALRRDRLADPRHLPDDARPDERIPRRSPSRSRRPRYTASWRSTTRSC